MNSAILDLLTSEDAAAFLENCLAHAAQPIKLVETIRTRFSEEQAREIAELVRLRYKARDKFQHHGRMFFTAELLEQATSEAVSRYKGETYFKDLSCCDLCCGLGGSTLGMAASADRVTAIDIAPLHVRMAALNLQAYELESNCTLKEMDITREIPPADAYHFDPSRRSVAGREYSPENYLPPLDTVQRIREAGPNVLAKVSPLHNLEALEEGCSADVVSLRGEVKEILLGWGQFHSGQTRAVLLPEAAMLCGPAQPADGTDGQVGEYIFDPDPAVVKAGLTGNAARECGLHAITPWVRYLTGSEAVKSRLVRAFKVLEVMPFNFKKLNRFLKAEQIGNITVKCKDTPIKPAAITKRLKPRGRNTAVLFYVEKEDGESLFVVAQQT
ncbi:hypothetical protein ACFL4W_05220 [Planctomycetota bacterium]